MTYTHHQAQEGSQVSLQPCGVCTGMGVVMQSSVTYLAVVECECCKGLGIEVAK